MWNGIFGVLTFSLRFLLATIMLDRLQDCYNEHSYRQQLESMPKSLTDVYCRMLFGVTDRNFGAVYKILNWLAFSVRPLTLAELAETVAIDATFDPHSRFSDPLHILKTCSGLVSSKYESTASVHDTGSSIIGFVHSSLKDCLLSEDMLPDEFKHYRINETSAHELIYSDCLKYLFSLNFSTNITLELLAQYPLAQYAAQYWTHHARFLEHDIEIEPVSAMLPFLDERDTLLQWIRLCDPENSEMPPKLHKSINDICSPLYYASIAGLPRSVQSLIDRGADVNARKGRYGNALQAASSKGHLNVVYILLESGADVNARGGKYGSALGAAIAEGHQTVIKLLLDSGAEDTGELEASKAQMDTKKAVKKLKAEAEER